MSYVNSLAQTSYLQLIMKSQQTQITRLQGQVASGNKSSDFSGYSPTEGRLAISLSDSLSRNKQYQQTVKLLSTQAQLAEASLTNTHNVLTGGSDGRGTGSVSNTIANVYLNVASPSSNAAGSVQQTAQNALEAVIGYYNQSMTGGYVFAGRGSQPPFLDAGTVSANVKAAIAAARPAGASGFVGTPPAGASSLQAANAAAAAASAAVNGVFLNSSHNLNPGTLNQWFSGSINDSPGEPVPISDNQTLAIDISALPNQMRSGPIDANTGIAIDPTYGILDSIRALAAVANVMVADFGTGPDAPAKYQAFLKAQLDQISLADQEINTMTAVNGNNRALLQNTGSLLNSQSITLQSSIASTESVDQATAITNLQNLQSQLTATYQVTSMLKNLSLVNYIANS